MRRFVAATAVAVVALVFAVPSMAATDASAGRDTTTDLGQDVSGVPDNQQAVAAFMATLTPVARQAIVGGCETLIKHPEDATSQDSLPFCDLAVHS